jgi:hypothetical protein
MSAIGENRSLSRSGFVMTNHDGTFWERTSRHRSRATLPDDAPIERLVLLRHALGRKHLLDSTAACRWMNLRYARHG